MPHHGRRHEGGMRVYADESGWRKEKKKTSREEKGRGMMYNIRIYILHGLMKHSSSSACVSCLIAGLWLRVCDCGKIHEVLLQPGLIPV